MRAYDFSPWSFNEKEGSAEKNEKIVKTFQRMLITFQLVKWIRNLITRFLLLFIFKGTQRHHVELEQLLAEFLQVESSIVFGMVHSLISFFREEKKQQQRQ